MGIYGTPPRRPRLTPFPFSPSPGVKYLVILIREERKSCTSIAQDIYQTYFATNPYDKQAWAKYRSEILEYGGSQADEMQMLMDYLGRGADVNALVEGLKLKLK